MIINACKYFFLLSPNDVLFSFFYFLLAFYYFLDIDECLIDPCHGHASCHDTEGSFQCQCNVGYTGNGFNCSCKCIIQALMVEIFFDKCFNHLFFLFFCFRYFLDIDTCFSNPCHANAICHDTEGSLECECDDGYSGNGFNCSSKTII